MRLGTCVAVEFAVGASLALAVSASTSWGVETVRSRLAQRAEAASQQASVDGASTWRRVPQVLVAPLERPATIDPDAVDFTMFLGVRDEILLAPLSGSPLKRVKFNHGGSSISLRLDFENGARAAFKPVQTNLQTIPRREVAAYRLNRLLGLDSVAPARGGKFKQSDLIALLDPEQSGYSPRILAETEADAEGYVAGELSWWIPIIKRATVDGFRIDGLDGVVTWKRDLTIGTEIPAKDVRMVAQVSNMVLFDMLINNSDRWTGGNVRASDDGELLYFMDNTLSFGSSRDGHERTRIYLMRSQKFSRSLVARVRALDENSIRDAMAHDTEPFEELLSSEEIDALLARRDVALEYIDGLIAEHGEDAVLVFP